MTSMSKNTKSMNAAEKIDTILDEFDFAYVHRTMKALDWKWGGAEPAVPSIPELRKCARRLLRSAQREKGDFWVMTGGFSATKYKDGTLSLRFVIDEVMVDKYGEIVC